MEEQQYRFMSRLACRGPEEFEIPDILMFRRLPFRISKRQVAGLAGFRDDDAVGVLVEHRMIPPLGNPPKGAPLCFATATILKLANDVKWLDKATWIVREHTRAKNQKAKAKNERE